MVDRAVSVSKPATATTVLYGRRWQQFLFCRNSHFRAVTLLIAVSILNTLNETLDHVSTNSPFSFPRSWDSGPTAPHNATHQWPTSPSIGAKKKGENGRDIWKRVTRWGCVLFCAEWNSHSACVRSQDSTRPQPVRTCRVTNTFLSTAFTKTSDYASPAPAHAQAECYEQGVPALVQPCNTPHEPRATSVCSLCSDGDAGKLT
jgi:hypothetical protein